MEAKLALNHSDQSGGDVFLGEGAVPELWFIAPTMCWCDRWLLSGGLNISICNMSKLKKETLHVCAPGQTMTTFAL